MGFNKQQQGWYRPIVESAWQAHAAASSLDPKDKTARAAWYQDQLLTCVGVTSTSPLDQSRDFDRAIAHFESLLDSDTYWQEKAESGDYRRICWAVFAKSGPYKIDQTDITPQYLREIAQQAFRMQQPPQLSSLCKDSLIVVIKALAIHAGRRRESTKR